MSAGLCAEPSIPCIYCVIACVVKYVGLARLRRNNFFDVNQLRWKEPTMLYLNVMKTLVLALSRCKLCFVPANSHHKFVSVLGVSCRKFPPEYAFNCWL